MKRIHKGFLVTVNVIFWLLVYFMCGASITGSMISLINWVANDALFNQCLPLVSFVVGIILIKCARGIVNDWIHGSA